MPITLSAVKKLKQDRRRKKVNDRLRDIFKQFVKQVRKNPSKSLIGKASSALDRAVKKHVIHKNKAARLKSRLAQMVR